MQFLTFAALLASAVSVSAATTSAAAPVGTSTSSCAAQNILDACLQTETDLFNSCGTNDWNCKCNAYGAIVTCYNNCPSDQTVVTAKGQQQIFCGYASQYPSATPTGAKKTGTATTSATKATGTKAAASAGSSTDSGSGASGSASSGTASGTAKPPAETHSGADLAIKSGSMLFAVAGMAAALL
ncbi:GPI anchored serine-threonineeeee rich protein [Sporothrix schenckii 1099-18]|uniref:GPI anchored serine-threonineeeee rich protein n=1 Tax=Sporothrix schenckii 1099-18 TaxID=1397361 RepID=A0A0F2M8Z3_SPOSC|nr:GPI anchored serine-threonineeeee rich protein [Sporothrix schenckii 1099-18]KJR84631.1 GPI anchored serine-threonineeeee rich protein [Sporothrix schenckii 1099-18]